jgi:hypothetical protein
MHLLLLLLLLYLLYLIYANMIFRMFRIFTDVMNHCKQIADDPILLMSNDHETYYCYGSFTEKSILFHPRSIFVIISLLIIVDNFRIFTGKSEIF